MPARKGVKDPTLLARSGRGQDTRTPVAYVVHGKPLRYGVHVLTDGIEVPGAADWLRLEAWVASRRLRPVYAGEPYTSFETYLNAYEYSRMVTNAASTPVEDETQEE